jgi:hypothetical protein
MPIDTSFDFRTDASGRDPDSYSATLCRYHKFLWSRALPSGALFNLEVSRRHGKYALHHRSELGEFCLTSDSITHTYTKWSALKHITELFPEAENEAFRTIGYTIGGMLVFPGNIIDRKPTINGARGMHPKMMDRFDLTLECIRRHYIGQHSPLEDTLKRYGDFFALFEDFKGYVEFFMLQDLVVNDYSGVIFLMPFDNFRTSPVPGNVDTYKAYRRLTIDFLEARNRRIDRYTASSRVFGASSDHSLFNSILGDHEEQRIPQKLAWAVEEMTEPKHIPEQEPMPEQPAKESANEDLAVAHDRRHADSQQCPVELGAAPHRAVAGRTFDGREEMKEMDLKPTTAQMVEALRQMKQPEHDDRLMVMLRAHRQTPKTTMPELARAAGYANHSGANGAYGRVASQIRSLTGIPRQVALGLIVDFDKKVTGEPWRFTMRAEFIDALVLAGWLEKERDRGR